MALLGLQLYTVRTACAGNLADILKAVAAGGFRCVEFAGYHGVPAATLREALTRNGMSAISSHVSLELMRRDYRGVVADARTLGCRYITVPSAPPEAGTRSGDWRSLREELRFYARLLAGSNMLLCYHNHAREFEPLDDGTCPFDVLFEDEELYFAQVDVYWAAYAGRDPGKLLGRLAGRCPTIHVKDMAASKSREPAIIGEGVLDWPSLIGTAQQAGVQCYIVEQDNPAGDPLESARASYAYLTQRFPAVFGG
jgi:sugar phosphate isomerase/epimerase